MSSSVRRLIPGALGALLIFVLMLVVKTAEAGIPCDCICERGESDQGYRVVMSNKPGCTIYQAVRLHPQVDPTTHKPYPEQIQLRSMWAANTEVGTDGTVQQHGVLSGCTRDGKPSPDADAEELATCKHLKHYYTLSGVEVTIPKHRVYTPSEQKVLDAAAAVEKQRQDKAAEQKKDEEKRELAAEKRAKELEAELKAEKTKTQEKQDEIDATAEIAWRAKFFTTAVIVICLASAWALAMMFAAAVLRVRLRPITIDGYRYPNPVEAAKDVAMKFEGLRAELKATKDRSSQELAAVKIEVANLTQKFGAQTVELGSARTQVASLTKERDGFKSSFEMLRKERGQGVEPLRQEVERLGRENSELLAAWNDADEARIQLEGLRGRQASLLMEAQAESQRLQKEVGDLKAEVECLRYVRKPESEPAPAMSSLLESQDEEVTQVRVPVVTPSAKPPYKRHQTAPYPLAAVQQFIAEREQADRANTTETTNTVGLGSELSLYQQGFAVIANNLPGDFARKTASLKLEERIRSTVEAVGDVCSRAAAAVRTQTSRPLAASSGTIPPMSNSDIVRVAAHFGLDQEFDLAAFKRGLSGASDANAAECLRTCIHEWAGRAERLHDGLVYVVDLPYELYDLHAFLNSSLLYGDGVAPMVPDDFMDKMYQIKHAGDPVFARRPRMSSFPPSAMAPQA